MINRLRQSGSAEADNLQQAQSSKAKSELLANHQDVARESLKYYREMKDKCTEDWKLIQDLAKSSEF